MSSMIEHLDIEFERLKTFGEAEILLLKGEGGVISEEVKQALLECFRNVAWVNEHGQDYVDALRSALYPPATLVSISAVYTQSGTIYPTDTLDDLKEDLVVTATYSDGVEVTAPTYVLSGTLTVGDSVITVSYGGKTTTFTVEVTRIADTYAIINNLTGASSSNSATYITEGNSYSATITANPNHTLVGATISITMGGVDITSTAYDDGTISIAEVTGDLVINVVAVAIVVVSISAVYTQSGTVYDTDSLDDLKNDLVVTATYNDNSTSVVPSNSYTLSGTLAEGTSTITVSYSGKTTTFNVTVTKSVVPRGYTAYDYVKYTGTNKTDDSSAINMILKTKSYNDLQSLIFDFDVSPNTSVSSATNILGGQSASGNNNLVNFFGRNDTQRVSVFSHGTALGIDSIPNMALNKVCHIRLNPNTSSPSTLEADSLTTSGAWTASPTVTSVIGYCGNYLTHSSKATIKKFASIGVLKLYDVATENLVGEYIPCVRETDNVIGLWDRVTETFYTANTDSYATVGDANCVWAVGNWEV